MKRHRTILKTLKTYLFATTAILSLAHTQTNAQDWENMSPELWAYTLNKLLEDGDYQAFGRAYLMSKKMKKTVDDDPLWQATYNGIKQLNNQKVKVYIPYKTTIRGIQDIISAPEPGPTEISSLVKKAEEISGSVAKEFQQQVFNNLLNWIFANINKALAKEGMTFNVSNAMFGISRELPEKGFLALDRYMTRFMKKTDISDEDKYFIVSQTLLGLSGNKNIPTDLTVEKIEQFVEDIKRLDIPKVTRAVTENVNNALRIISKRDDMGEKTIQYFKKHQNDSIWEQNATLHKIITDLIARDKI